MRRTATLVRSPSPSLVFYSLLTLSLTAFGARALTLDTQSLWRDEVDVLRFAYWPAEQLWQNLIVAQHNGPLYYIVMRGWLTLAGQSEFALRFVALCASVLSVPLTWRVARPLVGARAAWLAALLMVFSPAAVWYGQDAKMYALVSLLVLVALIGLWQALRTGQRRYWIGFVTAASISFYTHMLAALMIPVYALALPLTWRSHRHRWSAWLASMALLTLPYLPLAAWQWPLLRDTYQTGHPFYPLPHMLNLLFNLYAWGMASTGHWLVLAAWIFALLMGIFGKTGPRTGQDLSGRVFIVVWLCLPAAFIHLVSLRAPVFEPRYLMFGAPAFYILTARGIAVLARLARPVSALVLALILVFNLMGLGVQSTTPIKSDFRSAATYVQARYRTGTPVLFQLPYTRHIFDYYFEADFQALDGPWTNGDKSETDVAAWMAAALGNESEVWLIASEGWLWDSRDLTRAWLAAHAELLEAASFVLVDVYHYRLHP